MKPIFHIRDARDDEHEAIRSITLTAYEEYSTIMPIWWRGYRRRMLAALSKDEPVERIVAEREGTLIGSVLLYPPTTNAYAHAGVDIGWPEVRFLAVVPEERGQGVGSALIDECERRVRNTGATVLGLRTIDIMQAAQYLYERRGFIRVPEADFSSLEDVHVKGYSLSLTVRGA